MNYEYKVGGSLPPDAPTYVWRQADYELFDHLRKGTFCYVLNSRQMGKSSLLVQTMRRLKNGGIACAAIDLTEIISPDITRSEFYGSITDTLVDTFNLAEQIGSFDAWWGKHGRLSPIKRLSKFIKEVLLTNPSLLGQNIVIFIDEIDSVLRLPFSANDFFSLIRACHNNRAEQPEYDRLTFAILGVASPSDLIRERNNSTPFNFGKAIELNGFQLPEVKPLAEGLKFKSENPDKLLEAVLSWTGGQPFLTQKLCKLIIDSEDTVPCGGEAEWVERLVRSRIIQNWESQDEPEHLRTIRDRILRDEKRCIKLLKLYQQILQQRPLDREEVGGIAANDSAEQMEMRLSGLVAKHQGKLKVRNLIYESVFNQNWVEKSLNITQPEIEPRDVEFIKTLAELERKLLVSQLSQIAEGKGSAQALYDVLRHITLQIGDLLGADRATIYLLNEEKTELWSLVAENEGDEFLDIQLQVGEGVAGKVAEIKRFINIRANLYQDPRSVLVKEFDKKYGYHTYNLLAIPILNDSKEVVSVIQLLNKLKQPDHLNEDLYQKIDKNGFTKVDRERLNFFVPSIQRILESCRSSYKATKKLRATAALAEATRSLDKSNLDTKEILRRVMDAAKKLMNADRSTLWLMDSDRGDLWTELPHLGELRCKIGVGFAGQVAQSREPIIIPFDLYDHPNASNAKKTDKETGYRTCSLLCMPVLNPEGELLGVTQLLNKRKSGDFPEYNPADWPKAPEQFKASFDENDRHCMQVFNERAGVILQYAKTHETLKHIAQSKSKEVVHNTLVMLSNAVGNQDDESWYNALYNMLNLLTQSIAKLVDVEQVNIFLFNADNNKLWSVIVEDKGGMPTEITLPAEGVIAGQIIDCQSREPIQLNVKLWDDLHYYKYIYNTYVIPLWNERGDFVAIVELVKKLIYPQLDSDDLLEKIDRIKGVSSLLFEWESSKNFSELQAHPTRCEANPKSSLAKVGIVTGSAKTPTSHQIENPKSADPNGFTESDFDRLSQRTSSMLPILEGFQSFYREIKTIQKQRALKALWSAISSVSQSSWNSKEILQRVMSEAKKLTNADRSTLWLVDREAGELWTDLPGLGEMRCKIGIGFVGQVAQSCQPLIIPFDLYDRPSAENAKKTDRETGYRTCSLLCMPVLGFDGELLGVTQLLNKRKSGDFPEYNSAEWPKVPDYFKASFNETDLRYMEIFNNQIGVVLQSAQPQTLRG
ncbi:GAF domain-containing protein [Aerosakkonema funiforme]|uniref:GAF domain-containing protein n=1 Tax=Aerosakkonema funiforme TaxID=1246630 RepID=UPI0035B7DF45